MKKILLLCAALMMAGFSHAQIRIGIKAGWVNDQLKNKDVSHSAKTGFEAGLMANMPIAYGFAFQPELLYSQKASGESKASTIASGSWTYTTSNVELPLNIQWGYQFDERLNLRPFVMAGPYFSYAIGRKLESSGSFMGIGHSGVVKGDDLDSKIYKPFDWGFNLGLGVDVWKLQFAVRYQMGMGDVIHADHAEHSYRFRGWAISLGFLF